VTASLTRGRHGRVHVLVGTLMLASVIVLAAGATSSIVATDARDVAGFDLVTRQAVWELPGVLREVSGLAPWADGLVLAHQDERAEIFLIDYQQGRVVQQWHMGLPTLKGDFEGIDVDGSRVTLMTSDGRLTSGELPSSGSLIARVTRDDTRLKGLCEFEGLAHTPWGAWVLPCKAPKSRGSGLFSLYFLRPTGAGTFDRTVLDIRRGGFKKSLHPSSVAVTARGSYVVLFGPEHAIGEFSASGETLALIELDRRRHPQPEGLALTTDGRLLIADEGPGSGDRGRLTVYGPTIPRS